MRRLIMTGFGCPPDAWCRLFPQQQDQKIFSLADLLTGCSANNLRELGKSAAVMIESCQPEILIMHDFGVLFGLLALIELKNKKVKLPPKIVIFNGGFRGFNVLESRHPFKIQLATFEQLQAKFKLAGGELDPRLKPYLSRIKNFYRQIIMASLLTLIKELFQKRKSLNINLGSRILILASSNDPFIPLHNLKQIAADFRGATLEIMDYRHFPYSGSCDVIRNRVLQFENQN